MTTPSSTTWPLAVYALAVVGMVVATMVISALIGQRHRERATGVPFESGIPPTGTTQQRIFTEFYLIALFAILFDLEAVFLFAWAVAARELGWSGYIQVLVFISILGAALAYLWRTGALDWAHARPLPKAAAQEKAGAP